MADKAPAKVIPTPAERFDAIVDKLNLETEMTTGDSESLNEFIKGTLADIGEADDFAAINAGMEGVSLPASKDLVGRTFVIQDFALRPSTKEGGRLKKYAIIKAIDENGEEYIFEGGGDNFVVGLVRMRDLYDFPYTGTITGRPTANNQTLLGWRFQDPKRDKIQ
jgi:hypothetical protein